MNDIGVNVAQVLDDLQCSYMNNSEYVRMSRIEEYNNSPKQGKFDLTKVLKDQGSDSRGFDDMWGGGIVMNWTLVPVEQQKPHINWRQAIDDDGSGLGRLASWMDINAGMTAPIVNATNNEEKINVYLKNQKAMDENKNNDEYKQYIIEGREHTENTIDLARTDYENYEDKIKEAIENSTDLDVLAVLSAAVAEQHTTDYKMITDTYRQCAQTIGSNNPALVWTAVGTNTTIVKKYVDGTLDAYLNGGQQNVSTLGTTAPTNSSTEISAPTIIDQTARFPMKVQKDAMREVNYISVHHAGSPLTLEGFYRAGVYGHGHGGTSYHFVILEDGSINLMRPETVAGNGVGSFKSSDRLSYEDYHCHCIDICLSGYFGLQLPTQAQIDSLTNLLAYKMKQYGIKDRQHVLGHCEFYVPVNEPYPDYECPGQKLQLALDDIVAKALNIQSSGTYSVVDTATAEKNAREKALWVDFVEKIKKGLEKEGKTSTAGLNLFPKICYMYVKLMNDVKNSSFDGDSGWGFPYTDDIIQQTPEKCVFLTGHVGETSGHAGKHEGIDLQPSGVAENPSTNVPFCAVKDGVAYTEGQWCNGIYVKHDDGTWARFLHCRSRSVSNGQRVQRGQQIGITGGHDGSIDTAYPVHLHVEFGKQKDKAPYEKVYNDDCLIDPEDCWRKPNGTDSVSGKPMWTL